MTSAGGTFRCRVVFWRQSDSLDEGLSWEGMPYPVIPRMPSHNHHYLLHFACYETSRLFAEDIVDMDVYLAVNISRYCRHCPYSEKHRLP